MKWEELSPETQKRLQGSKKSLSKADKKLRKELYWGDGWKDVAGHSQQLRLSTDRALAKHRAEEEEKAKALNTS